MDQVLNSTFQKWNAPAWFYYAVKITITFVKFFKDSEFVNKTLDTLDTRIPLARLRLIPAVRLFRASYLPFLALLWVSTYFMNSSYSCKNKQFPNFIGIHSSSRGCSHYCLSVESKPLPGERDASPLIYTFQNTLLM